MWPFVRFFTLFFFFSFSIEIMTLRYRMKPTSWRSYSLLHFFTLRVGANFYFLSIQMQ